MRDFLVNFVDNKLNRLEQSIDNPSRNSSFVSNFLKELQNSLDKFRSYEIFQNLPRHTRFHFTGQSGDLLEIMAFDNKELYFVPRSIIDGDFPKLGEGLRFSHEGRLIIHHGGIPLWEDQIEEFRNQCTLAR